MGNDNANEMITILILIKTVAKENNGKKGKNDYGPQYDSNESGACVATKTSNMILMFEKWPVKIIILMFTTFKKYYCILTSKTKTGIRYSIHTFFE